MKNKLQNLRDIALSKNPKFEEGLDSEYIEFLLTQPIDNLNDSTNLKILESLNYRINRLNEIRLSDYAEDTIICTTEIIYSYYIELLYNRGYSAKQIKILLDQINSIKNTQPELSIMGEEVYMY